jgi:RHS repeat-associated protein
VAASAARSRTYTFTAGTTAEGEYEVTATDRATNAGTASFTLVRDGTPPAVAVTATVQAEDIRVTWEARDATSGLGACRLKVEKDDGSQEELSTSCAGERIYTEAEPGHHYTFHLTATDNVGNQASAEATSGLPRVVKYFYHGGQRVAMRSGGQVFYLHGDHLGSVSLVTDAGGNEHAHTLFYPYGDTRYTSGDSPTDFGFAGQRHDGTGLVFMHARYYDPLLARFISADTIVPEPGNPQAQNRYAYAYNNSLRYTDPSGHGVPAILGVALIVAGLAALTVEAVQIHDYAERYDMTFWEAAVDPDLYLDQWAMVEAAAAAFVGTFLVAEFTIAALAGGAGLLAEVGARTDWSFTWRWAVSLNNAAAGLESWLWSAGGDAITARLQELAGQAVQEIDDMGDAAFTDPQREALINNPGLRQAFRGSAIDAKFKELIRDDPVLQHLDTARLFQFMPDVVDPATGRWWDLTKPWLWQDHLDKYGPVYGPDGTLIPYE